jgi:hypothetical protein
MVTIVTVTMRYLGVYFDIEKYLAVSFSSHLKRAFSVLLEYTLRVISGTCCAAKNRFRLSAPKLS